MKLRTSLVFLLLLSMGISCEPDGAVPHGSGGETPCRQVSTNTTDKADGDLIRVGIQPLWLVGGTLGEVMRRDRVLQESLSTDGSRVEVIPFLDGPEMAARMAAGGLEAAIASDFTTLRMAATRAMVVTVLAGYGYDDLVAHRPLLPEELDGLSIGFVPNSTSHASLLDLLDAEGVASGQVRLIPTSVTNLAGALSSGQVDALAVWEPVALMTETSDAETVVVHRSRHFGFLSFTREFALADPAGMREIISSLLRAQRWVTSHQRHLNLAARWTIRSCGDLLGTPIKVREEQVAYLITRRSMLSVSPLFPWDEIQEGRRLFRLQRLLGTAGRRLPTEMFDDRVAECLLDDPQQAGLDRFKYEGIEAP